MNSDRRPIEIQTDAAYANASDDEYDSLTTAWGGVVLAGGCFPVFAFLVASVLFAFGHGLSAILPGATAEDLILVTAMVATSFCVGLVYAAVMSIPAFLLLQTFRFFTRWMLTDRGACGAFGGLTGFICITGFGVFPTLPFQDFNLDLFIMIASAIALGHFGAVCMGFRHGRKTAFPFASPFLDADKRISIKFLMLVTAGFAIFIACCKAMGPAGVVVGISWTCYAVFQLLLLLVERSVIKWLKISN